MYSIEALTVPKYRPIKLDVFAKNIFIGHAGLDPASRGPAGVPPV